jgi:hypothetical protein
LLLVIAVGIAATAYLRYSGKRRLLEVIAQLDRTDPGWRWDALQEKRVIASQEQNAAARVEAIVSVLPARWPANASAGKDGVPQPSLSEAVENLDPNQALDDLLTKRLQVEQETVRPALDLARRLEELRDGNFKPRPITDLVAGKSDYCSFPRRVAELLSLDAAFLAQNQKPDEALQSARGILMAGRALGDDPYLMAQMARGACRVRAGHTLERILAQGQPSAAALARTQQMLEEEEAQPLLLIALRGERAWQDRMLTWMAEGEWARLQGSTAAPGLKDRLLQPLSAGWVKKSHAELLELMSQCIEIAKMPAEKQRPKFRELEQDLPRIRESYSPLAALSVPAALKAATSLLRSRLDIRCGIVALACERFRLANGKWPKSLDQLSPNFLTKVPLDLFDGKPLRLIATNDGLAIYSTDADGVNHGGELRRSGQPGSDASFRLWNVNKRRQASGKQ